MLSCLEENSSFVFWNFICMPFGRNVEFATCKEVDRAQLSGYF